MRRTRLAAAACTAGLLAGCGSSTKPKTTTAPPTTTGGASTAAHGPAMATTGTAGKVGPSATGQYSASNSDVLFHIRVALVRFFTSKGFSGVTAQCKGVSTVVASCNVMGTNKSNQTSSAVLTLSVDQGNGVLRITHVST
jgi:hypothetical protein